MGLACWDVLGRDLGLGAPSLFGTFSSHNKTRTIVPTTTTKIMANNNQNQVINLANLNETTFTNAGPPTPLERPKFGKGHHYKSAKMRKAEAKFRAGIVRELPQVKEGCIYSPDVSLSITLEFYLPRPNRDFVACDRPRGIIKPAAMARSSPPTGPDVDNLAKFVLDAMTGVVYPDDKQVVKLVCLKVRDNEGACHGRTKVHVEHCPNAFGI